MKLLIFCLCIFLLNQAIAQNNLPPVFEIKTDTVEWQEIDSVYWQTLEEGAEKWTIEDITTVAVTNKFHYKSQKISTVDAAANTYWFHYRLKNVMNSEARIALASISQYDDFYLPQPDGKWTHFVSGSFADLDKKNGLKKVNCIPLIMRPGEQLTVYQRISNKIRGLPPDFTIAIVSTDKTIQQYYVEEVDNSIRYSSRELQEMFLEGVLLLSIFINLLFFRIVRE